MTAKFTWTPKEFEFSVHLARAGKVVQHREVLSAVWDSDHVEQLEYLRVFAGQLRKKVEPEDGTRRYIPTERWIGYRFFPESTPTLD